MTKLLIIILLFGPLLELYSFPILINNLFLFILILIGLPLSIINWNFFRIKIRKTSYLVLYSQFIIWITFVYILMFSNAGIHSYNSMFSFVLSNITIIILLLNKFDVKFLIGTYCKIALCFSILLIIQFVVYYGMNYSLLLKIPFLSYYDDNVASVILESGKSIRIASVFSEPSTFCLYVFPAAIIYMIGIQGVIRKNYYLSSLIILSILLSTSGNGITILFLFGVLYSVDKLTKKWMFISFVIFIGILYTVYKIGYLNDIILNIFIPNEYTGLTKADYRVYRGFLIYNDLPFINQLLGLGWRNATPFMQENNIKTIFDFSAGKEIENLEYFNSICQILIYSGIIGLILFLRYCISIYRNNIKSIKYVVLLICFLMFSSSLLGSAQWLVYMILIGSGVVIQNRNKCIV